MAIRGVVLAPLAEVTLEVPAGLVVDRVHGVVLIDAHTAVVAARRKGHHVVKEGHGVDPLLVLRERRQHPVRLQVPELHGLVA